MYIPYSGEFIELTSVDPIRFTLVLDRGMEESTVAMEQLDERTFRYASPHYPIVITVRLVEVSKDAMSARVIVKAERK